MIGMHNTEAFEYFMGKHPELKHLQLENRLEIEAYDTNLAKLEIARRGSYPTSDQTADTLHKLNELGLENEAYIISPTEINGIKCSFINFCEDARNRIKFQPHD